MAIDAAQLAVLLGLANGVVLLLKPIARVHQRIDRNEQSLIRLERDVAKLLAALNTDRRDH